MVHKGTVEWFRQIYMHDGLGAMVEEIKELLEKTDLELTNERMDKFIQGILYGSNSQGVINQKPSPPNPFDMTEHPELYDFQSRVYKDWVGMMEGVKKLECEV
mgnify:CR=1 FL=1